MRQMTFFFNMQLGGVAIVSLSSVIGRKLIQSWDTIGQEMSQSDMCKPELYKHGVALTEVQNPRLLRKLRLQLKVSNQ